MTVLTQDQELVCQVCGRGPFKNNAGMASHVRSRHGDMDIPEPPKPSDDKDLEELKTQLREALDRAEQAEQERDEYKPTKSIEDFILNNKDDVVARFGRQKLEDLARKELAVVNRRRASQNLPPIDFGPEEMERRLQEVMEDLLNDRILNGAATSGPLPKTLKMLVPNGSLVQIPYEAQINNLAGSMEDAIARYRNKGYKLAVDDEGRMLCPAQNCWNSATTEGGRNVFGGYCSADHQTRTEQNKGQPIDPAIYTRR